MKVIGQIILVFLAAVSITGCSNINKVLKSSDYNYKLQQADKMFAEKKYSKAQIVYEDVFPVFKGSPEFERIYLNWAYCHYYQKDYLNAENIFKGFAESFPNSTNTEEAEYLRAYSYYKQSPRVELDQTSTYKAITFLQTFLQRYPSSKHSREAIDIIDVLEDKLELKSYKSAELYYNLGYYNAAAVAASELLFEFFDSDKADQYKLMVIKSRYKYAENSIVARQLERYDEVLNDCADFYDRYPESSLAKEVDRYKNLAENNLKSLRNEQTEKDTE